MAIMAGEFGFGVQGCGDGIAVGHVGMFDKLKGILLLG
jgi:hypothetical protein